MAIAEHEIVSGERLQAIADVALLTDAKRRGHLSIPDMPLAIFNPDKAPGAVQFDLLARAKTIFVYSDFLHAFFERFLPAITNPFVLLSGNSDVNIDRRFSRYLDDPRLLHWFGQNAAIRHPKLTATPIGIANAQWRHGDTKAVAEIGDVERPKVNRVYVNFEIGTNPRARAPILKALETKGFTFMGRGATAAVQRGLAARMRTIFARADAPAQQPPLPFRDYLAQLGGYKYCVSPPGNGLDCHRTWEALYLGVIPIVSESPVGLLDDLPHIKVADLRTIEFDDLEAAAAKLVGPFEQERLTMSYWRKRVRQAVSRS